MVGLASEQRAPPGMGSRLGEKPLECTGSPWTQEGERAKGKEGPGQDLVKNLGCVERGRASKDTEDRVSHGW